MPRPPEVRTKAAKAAFRAETVAALLAGRLWWEAGVLWGRFSARPKQRCSIECNDELRALLADDFRRWVHCSRTPRSPRTLLRHVPV